MTSLVKLLGRVVVFAAQFSLLLFNGQEYVRNDCFLSDLANKCCELLFQKIGELK